MWVDSTSYARVAMIARSATGCHPSLRARLTARSTGAQASSATSAVAGQPEAYVAARRSETREPPPWSARNGARPGKVKPAPARCGAAQRGFTCAVTVPAPAGARQAQVTRVLRCAASVGDTGPRRPGAARTDVQARIRDPAQGRRAPRGVPPLLAGRARPARPQPAETARSGALCAEPHGRAGAERGAGADARHGRGLRRTGGDLLGVDRGVRDRVELRGGPPRERDPRRGRGALHRLRALLPVRDR